MSKIVSVVQLGKRGNKDAEFQSPYAIDLDEQGNLYVIEYANHRVQKLNPQGTFMMKFGKKGSDDGEFKNPCGIALDGQRRICVADTCNHRIQMFDSQGNFVFKFGRKGGKDGEFKNPYSVDLDERGNIYVTDTLNHRIQKFESQGNFLLKFGEWGKGTESLGCQATPLSTNKEIYTLQALETVWCRNSTIKATSYLNSANLAAKTVS